MSNVAAWIHTRVYGVRTRNKRSNWAILNDKEAAEHNTRMLGYRDQEVKASRSVMRAYEKALSTYEDLNKDYVMEKPESDDDIPEVDGVGLIEGAIQGIDLPGGDHTRGAIKGFLKSPENRDKINLFIGNKFNDFLASQTKGGEKKLELISK